MTSTSGHLVKCSGCDKTYRVHPEKLPAGLTAFNCRKCGSLIPVAFDADPATSRGHKVIVAIGEEDLAGLVIRILNRGGLSGSIAPTGSEVMRLLREEDGFSAILLSVSLPDAIGYELLDQIRQRSGHRHFPVILLSTVHHSMRYKRAPSSLYGADDYIERHHLPDMLIPKLEQLLSPQKGLEEAGAPSVHEPHTDEQVVERRQIEQISRDMEVEPDPDDTKIRRMCRVICGDIALYNEDTIRSASEPAELMRAIAADLEEGEMLLAEKFPEDREKAAALLRSEMRELLLGRGTRSPSREREDAQ